MCCMYIGALSTLDATVSSVLALSVKFVVILVAVVEIVIVITIFVVAFDEFDVNAVGIKVSHELIEFNKRQIDWLMSIDLTV